MNHQDFQKVLDEQIAEVFNVLDGKNAEYASDADRLHNFDKASNLLGGSSPEAVIGMMAKHTVSVYDMVISGKSYPRAMWDEKITDHINYLILLKASIIDNNLAT